MTYSFLSENFIKKIGKYFAPKGVEKLINYSAAGTILGTTAGGVIGFLYGCKVYMSKDKTLEEMENKINDPDISSYARRNLIDNKNLIMSMTEKEYRNYIIKEFYTRGSAIGATAGTLVGSIVGRK